MPETESEAVRERRRWHQASLPPPNFWDSRRALIRLRRLQDLIRHDKRWETKLASPLATLLPGTPEEDCLLVIPREISKLIPLAQRALYWVQVETKIVARAEELEWLPGEVTSRLVEKERRYDLLLNYFQLPSENVTNTNRVLMQVLNHGIGLYEVRLQRSKVEFLNPLFWIAAILRISHERS